MYKITFIDSNGKQKTEKYENVVHYQRKIKILEELCWKIIKHGKV